MEEKLTNRLNNLISTHPKLLNFSKNIVQNSEIPIKPNVDDNTIISIDTIIKQTDIDSYTFPVIITGGILEKPVVIQFGENLLFNDQSYYFIIKSDYITIDGNCNTIEFANENSFNYNGLIQNGTGVDGVSNDDGFNNIVVKNISLYVDYSLSLIILQNLEYNQESGWICQPYYGNGKTNCLVDNCITNGFITGGGIMGCYSSGTITKCVTLGEIGTPILQILFNGNININFAGGIIGHHASNCTISNCITSGRIHILSGGIVGSISNCIINDCYAIGNIEVLAGGIVGAGSDCRVTNCYSNQQLTAFSGSIFSVECIGSAINCYTSTVYGSNTQIIFALTTIKNNEQIIHNCYSYNESWNN